MGLANIPDDYVGGYNDYIVKWPNSPQWDAILRGQLNAPAFTDFWDENSGDPSSSIAAMSATFDTNLHLEAGVMIPSGFIMDYAGSTIPDGWLVCDGSEISRTEYASLFAAIGEIYGAGNGTTTFELPYTPGKVSVAIDPTDADFNALGEFRGVKSVILEISEIPAHTHTQDAHTHVQNAHTHTIFGEIETAVGINIRSLRANSAGSNVSSGSTTATNQNTTATNQNTGGGEAHDNIQPSIVFNRLIKT